MTHPPLDFIHALIGSSLQVLALFTAILTLACLAGAFARSFEGYFKEGFILFLWAFGFALFTSLGLTAYHFV